MRARVWGVEARGSPSVAALRLTWVVASSPHIQQRTFVPSGDLLPISAEKLRCTVRGTHRGAIHNVDIGAHAPGRTQHAHSLGSKMPISISSSRVTRKDCASNDSKPEDRKDLIWSFAKSAMHTMNHQKLTTCTNCSDWHGHKRYSAIYAP